MTDRQPAYEHNGRPISREAFYAIACDPRRSVAVEACAGAGKTWMLVARIVRALLAGAQPHEILAITFTKKAAGEMRERLLQSLEQFSHASDEKLLDELRARGLGDADARAVRPALARLAHTVLASGRPVQIRTFHSWFAALLRSAPLAVLEELELPARYELLENDDEAVRRVWRRFWSAVVADAQASDDFARSVAAHGRSQTQKALTAVLARRVEFTLADRAGRAESSVRHFSETHPALAGFESPAQALGGDAARARWLAWAAALGAETNKTPRASADAVIDALQGPVDDACLARLRRAFLVADEDRLTHNLRKFPAAQEAAAELQLLCGAQAQHAAWLHQQRMVRLSRLLLAEFAQLKRERGWVDMNDVERAALRMLSDPVLGAWVQERLDARVRHLLIDEFQDTNPLQWQALHSWLSSYAGAGGDAPSVFVVGDPKQSIYRFRRADPQVFRDASEFVVQGLGGDRLACDHTWRNAHRVIDVVNAAMGSLAETGFEGFRPHTTESELAGGAWTLPPMAREADGESVTASRTAWRDSLAEPRELPEDSLRARECRQAALWLAPRIAAGLKPSDVMVLARKRDRLSAMEEALRALHIAAQQPEKTDLADVPEVQDVVALIDALVSPRHDLALARALRSPLFGASDADLAQLALRARAARDAGEAVGGGARAPMPTWFELLQGPDLPASLATVGPVLMRWKRWIDSLPPHDAIDAIFHDGDVLARFAAAAPAALREATLANLRALLGAALSIDGARYATPYALVRAIRAGGQTAPVVNAPDAVRLLTIHGAKGLEAPLVLMLDTDAPAPAADNMTVLIDWPGDVDAAAPLRFVFVASEKHPPQCAAALLRAEHEARRREEFNALYVALTRARHELVLSSSQPHRPHETSWWRIVQPLCEALPAPAPVPVPQAPPAPAAAPGQVRMRVLPPGPADVHNATPARVAQPSVAALDPADALAAAIGQAMHRMLEWQVSAGALMLTPAQRRSAAREFALAPADAERAARLARAVLEGAGRWAWDEAQIDWQANEMALHHEGRLLRLDRVVRRRDTGHWWVLDYKSATRPERDEALRAQLHGYRAALQAAQPGATVRVAFMTGHGDVVEIE